MLAAKFRGTLVVFLFLAASAEAQQQDVDSVRILIAKGTSLVRQGRLKDALPHLVAARMSVDTTFVDNVIAADTALAGAYAGVGRTDSAVIWMKDALTFSMARREAWRAAPVLKLLVAIESAVAAPETLLSHLRLLLSAQRAAGEGGTPATLHQLAEVYDKLNLPDSALSALVARVVGLKEQHRDSPDLWIAYSELGVRFHKAGNEDSAVMFTRLAVDESRRLQISKRVRLGTGALRPSSKRTPEECDDYTALFLNLLSMYHRLPGAASDSAIITIAADLERLQLLGQNRSVSSKVPLIEKIDGPWLRSETTRSWADLSLRLSDIDSVSADRLARAALAARERMIVPIQPSAIPALSSDSIDCDFRAPYRLFPYDSLGWKLTNGRNWQTPIVAYLVVGDEIYAWVVSPEQYGNAVSVERLNDGARIISRLGGKTNDASIGDLLLPPAIIEKIPKSGPLVISPDPSMTGIDFQSLTLSNQALRLGSRYAISIAPSLSSP